MRSRAATPHRDARGERGPGKGSVCPRMAACFQPIFCASVICLDAAGKSEIPVPYPRLFAPRPGRRPASSARRDPTQQVPQPGSGVLLPPGGLGMPNRAVGRARRAPLSWRRADADHSACVIAAPWAQAGQGPGLLSPGVGTSGRGRLLRPAGERARLYSMHVRCECKV